MSMKKHNDLINAAANHILAAVRKETLLTLNEKNDFHVLVDYMKDEVLPIDMRFVAEDALFRAIVNCSH